MDDFQFENLVIAITRCFKQHYCAMYFEDLARKFGPEIDELEVETALEAMLNRGLLTIDGSLLRLIVH